MARIVADTSALVSLGTAANHDVRPLDHLVDEHEVVVPERVVGELRETAAYDDRSGTGAGAVLERLSRIEVHQTELDPDFPLDDGENAAVTLANDLEATQLLCDEFNQLALVHASLATTRLVTTPTLLIAFMRNGHLEAADALEVLSDLRAARSWEGNAYVSRAVATLDRELD
ncbi:hypothetical protein [Natrarchaeobaculum aegyptiacum]|uniref:PIN domain-containing protein n=1 Tax=Natrarchaeobaculum aegyptiacum TaxID=745377 RepID=A0A2Z2HYN6_9EURY|nr:hypothetical protein [Natrarchaeobaculum aegyptiacum]ARS90927.1 hypothetical protein B1756_15115 [Natrarchaeobaculum aegyptiacum]